VNNNISLQFRNLRQRFLRQQEGAVALEFLITFPIILLIILGIIQFGHIMMVRNMATSAAREAARLAVLPSSSSDRQNDYPTYESDVKQRAIDVMAEAGITISQADVVLPEPVDLADGTRIQVIVNVDYDEIAIIPNFPFGGIILRGNVIMREEGF